MENAGSGLPDMQIVGLVRFCQPFVALSFKQIIIY
jgi:hypothetical protein